MNTPISVLPPAVAATVEQSYGHHRTRWFESILEEIGGWCARATGGGTPLILTATVSGAREAVVANCLAPGDTAWLAGDSAFAPHVAVAQGVAAALPAGNAAVAPAEGMPLVLLDHVTARGTVLDVESTVDAVRRAAHGAVVVLDASVSFGADVASLADWDLDGVILAPEGALMGIPGLSILVARDRFLDLARTRRATMSHRPFYLDVLKYEKVWAKRTTPYSPNISATVALGKAIELIEANGGLSQHVARHATRAASVRQALSAFVPSDTGGEARTNAFTFVPVPSGVDSAGLAAALDDHGAHATVVDGSTVRVDHAGYVVPGTLARTCARLAVSLRPGSEGRSSRRCRGGDFRRRPAERRCAEHPAGPAVAGVRCAAGRLRRAGADTCPARGRRPRVRVAHRGRSLGHLPRVPPC